MSVLFTMLLSSPYILLILLYFFCGMHLALLLLHTLELYVIDIRYYLAVLLLVFSGQSLALFMPGGTQVVINSDVTAVTSEGGC